MRPACFRSLLRVDPNAFESSKNAPTIVGTIRPFVDNIVFQQLLENDFERQSMVDVQSIKNLNLNDYVCLVIEALRSINGVGKTSAVREIIEGYLSERGVVEQSTLPSGESKLGNDIRWARYYLVNSGHIAPTSESGRGIWKLTPKGWSDALTKEFSDDVVGKSNSSKKSESGNSTVAPEEDASPSDPLQEGAWSDSLKKLLVTMPDKGFERLCAFLMTKNGLLAARVTGQAGDGGVDGEGLLAFDSLALIKTPVAWQCKRFETNKVPSKAVRDFRGAIDGRASYGLIFTTSTFTHDAELEARRAGATPIELVGLDRLIDMLKDREIGVKEKIIKTYEVEDGFFDEYLNPVGSSS